MLRIISKVVFNVCNAKVFAMQQAREEPDRNKLVGEASPGSLRTVNE